MPRLIAASLLLLFATSVSVAQPEPETKVIQTKVDESGEWTWTLAAEGEVPIDELLSIYASVRNGLVIYDARKLSGSTSFRGPTSTSLKGDEIDMFVSNALAEYRLVLTQSGQNQYKIIPAAEAITYAPVVAVADLETTPSWQWITTVFEPQYLDSNALRGALQNLSTRQGGVINPIHGGGLIVCDRADRVRALHEVTLQLDEGAATEIKVYDPPAGVTAASAVDTLKSLLGQLSKYRMSSSTFAVTEDSRVIARGPTVLHEEIVEAFAALKNE